MHQNAHKIKKCPEKFVVFGYEPVLVFIFNILKSLLKTIVFLPLYSLCHKCCFQEMLYWR